MPDYIRKTINLALSVIFIISSLNAPNAQAGEMTLPLMPVPGTMVQLSPAYSPAYLKGIVIHPENPFKFDFIINKGQGNLDAQEKNEEYTKLVKYFLASLTVPDQDQWVNLSPYEKERIIQPDFGRTGMGRDLLTQDYLLKEITSSLMYPESGLGKAFWKRVYARAWKEFGSTNVPVSTFNKVWIVPDQAEIEETGTTAYITQSRLKVMLEEDYLALKKNQAPNRGHFPRESGYMSPAGCQASNPLNVIPPRGNTCSTNELTSQIIRQIIIPELDKEVNQGQNFALLRQVFSGMLLAAWYKKALKESILGKIYADKSKIQGLRQPGDMFPRQSGGTCPQAVCQASELLNMKAPQENNPLPNDNDIKLIYQQYIKAFKKGVYNYIKEDTDEYTRIAIPRKYFAGGFNNNTAMITTFKPIQNEALAQALRNDSTQTEIAAVELSPAKDPAQATLKPLEEYIFEKPEYLGGILYAARGDDDEQLIKLQTGVLVQIDNFKGSPEGLLKALSIENIFKGINLSEEELRKMSNIIDSFQKAVKLKLQTEVQPLKSKNPKKNNQPSSIKRNIILFALGILMEVVLIFFDNEYQTYKLSIEQEAEQQAIIYQAQRGDDWKDNLTPAERSAFKEEAAQFIKLLQQTNPSIKFENISNEQQKAITSALHLAIIIQKLDTIKGNPAELMYKDLENNKLNLTFKIAAPHSVGSFRARIYFNKETNELIIALDRELLDPKKLDMLIFEISRALREADEALTLIHSMEFKQAQATLINPPNEKIFRGNQDYDLKEIIVTLEAERFPLLAAAIQKDIKSLKPNQAMTAGSRNHLTTGTTIESPGVSARINDGLAKNVNQAMAVKRLSKDAVTRQENPTNGGIDMNAGHMKMLIKRDAKGIALPFSQQDLAQLSRINGFVPSILEIRPVSTLIDSLRTSPSAQPSGY